MKLGEVEVNRKKILCVVKFSLVLALFLNPAESPADGGKMVEIREYQGRKLDPFDRAYDNSIKGPQQVDVKTYRLVIDGLVKKSASLTYAQAMEMNQVERVVVMHCVEGWSERLLFKGVRLADLFKRAEPRDRARYATFSAVDGYSSSLPLDFIKKNDLILASQVNGLVLDQHRGFPFWLVAQDKLGYKWVKWVVRIELGEKAKPGYWEKRGYSDEAQVPASRTEE